MRIRPTHARFAPHLQDKLPTIEEESWKPKRAYEYGGRRRSSAFKTVGLAVLTLGTVALLFRYFARSNALEKSSIPKKIWYKLGSKGLDPQTKEWTDTCIKANPSYSAKFLTDDTADAYVASAFSDRPSIVETYHNLSVPILKADLLRYLLLYNEGGIWSDLDVSCGGLPMDKWIPSEYKKDTNFVLGWEFDVGWPIAVVRQFATWTMMAQPGSRHLLRVIEDILASLHEKAAESNVPLKDMTRDMFGDVIEVTGPRRLTWSILKSLEAAFNSTIPMGFISELMQPKLVGDVLIMPGWAFAASSNHYGDKKVPPPLVEHHFVGSWRNEYGGEIR